MHSSTEHNPLTTYLPTASGSLECDLPRPASFPHTLALAAHVQWLSLTSEAHEGNHVGPL